jgi:LuxR family maltose regulon positive regulatory protein
VLQALAMQASGNTAQALACLEKALSLAEPEGYVRVFVDEGAPMAALLGQARGASPTYVASLLATFRDAKAGAMRASARARQAGLVEPLSERELEVLQLLAGGLTNQEIAQRLFITLPTVKSHAASICGKLGVHSRREAVAQATKLGLLP